MLSFQGKRSLKLPVSNVTQDGKTPKKIFKTMSLISKFQNSRFLLNLDEKS